MSLVDTTIRVGGWVRTCRDQKDLTFLDITDGSTMAKVQVVLLREALGEDVFARGSKLTTGSCVRVEGKVVRSTGKDQLVEVMASSLEILGEVVADEYPLAKARLPIEHLRTIQHLRPRTNVMAAVTRVRNACAFAVHRFFQERGFLYIHTPIITTSDCEGAGEMFGVSTIIPADPKGDFPRKPDRSIDYSKDFFARPASLTVSGQLQVECFACSMSDVYTFGPTFRAENSNTARHLAEFWMIEPEIAFGNLEDDMALAEDFLKYCTAYVLEHCRSDLEFFEDRVEKGLIARLENVVREPFQRMTYRQAIELLQQPEMLARGKFEVPPSWGMDMGSEHERFLTDQVFKKPVIVTNYPKEIKAFYMRLDEDGRTVQGMDILVPQIGEIIGGSVREERLDVLLRRCTECHVDTSTIDWYLDLRRHGTVPHAGFGLGFERLVMYVSGMSNIRDAIPFPRFPGHADV